MIFADPPYHLSKYKWDMSKGVEADFDFHVRWINACRRVLKPRGTIWVTGTHHSIHQSGFALQKLGFEIINDIVWYKSKTIPHRSKHRFAAWHETVIWARKYKDARHLFNYHLMRRIGYPDDPFKKAGMQIRSVWMIRNPSDFWAISPAGLSEKREGEHPTQKPLALLKRIILAASRPGDLILDPFAGSSTTGIAAYELGRSFIGIEREKDFLDLSIRRFEELCPQEKKISDAPSNIGAPVIIKT